MLASIEQGCQTLLDAVSDVQRQCLDRGGWIHTTGRDEDAAIDDEQVLHVMAASPGIHHRTLGIVAHACRAEQVPAAIEHGALDEDVPCTGSGQDLLAAINREIEHAAGVLADSVVDAWRR